MLSELIISIINGILFVNVCGCRLIDVSWVVRCFIGVGWISLGVLVFWVLVCVLVWLVFFVGVGWLNGLSIGLVCGLGCDIWVCWLGVEVLLVWFWMWCDGVEFVVVCFVVVVGLLVFL